MATPKDILLSAYIVIKQHGDDAEQYATQKMWELRHKPDEEGANAWLQIIRAIEEIRNKVPPSGLN